MIVILTRLSASFLAVVALWGGLFSSGVLAQQLAGTGSISGIVRDASGGSIPDAQVEVRNESRGIRRVLKTDSGGMFSALALEPAGGYRVVVAKEGFAAQQKVGVGVQVGADVTIMFTLAIAESQTSVAVVAAAPMADLTRMGVYQGVTDSQIMNLPINGRRVDTYVLLTPAVVPDGVLGLVSFRGIAGGNAFLTDGNDTSNQFFDENAGRTRIFTQISQDAVQEFQVLSSGYSSEYGRASGGIVNTLTRSGSNLPYG